MNVIDYPIKCSVCSKKMGVVSLVYIGVPHHTGLKTGVCMECLPQKLKDAEESGYNPESIKCIKEWLEK